MHPAHTTKTGVAAKLLGWVVTSLLGVPDAEGAVSFSALLGVLVFVVHGFAKAYIDNPRTWASNVWRVVRSAVVSQACCPSAQLKPHPLRAVNSRSAAANTASRRSMQCSFAAMRTHAIAGCLSAYAAMHD